MRKFVLILGLLVCASKPARADIHNCTASNVTTCGSFTIAQHGVVVVLRDAGTTSETISSSSAGLTYVALNTTSPFNATGCVSRTTSGLGALAFCANYALTGTTGATSETITFSAARDAIAHFYPSTDVLNSGNPLDTNCTGDFSFPSGNSNTSTCSLTSNFTNDVFMYQVINGASGSCNMTTSAPSNGPTVTSYILTCGSAMINYDNSTGNQIASGAAQTFTAIFPISNSSGSAGTLNVNLVTLKPPASTGGVRHKSTLTQYHPVKKFTPLLLYTILRNWIKEAYEGRA